MTVNIAAMSPDIRKTFTLQQKASLWVYRVTKREWTRERVRLELSKIEDEAERDELRAWLRHYDTLAKTAAEVATKAGKKRPRYVAR